MAPQLDTVARRRAGEWLVVKVNTEELSDLAGRYRIQSIPTLAVVRGGRELSRAAGARSAADIEQLVERALSPEADTGRAQA